MLELRLTISAVDWKAAMIRVALGRSGQSCAAGVLCRAHTGCVSSARYPQPCPCALERLSELLLPSISLLVHILVGIIERTADLLSVLELQTRLHRPEGRRLRSNIHGRGIDNSAPRLIAVTCPPDASICGHASPRRYLTNLILADLGSDGDIRLISVASAGGIFIPMLPAQ